MTQTAKTANWGVALAAGIWFLMTKFVGPPLDKNTSLVLPFLFALATGAIAFAVIYHRAHPAQAHEKRLYQRMSLYVLAGAVVIVATNWALLH